MHGRGVYTWKEGRRYDGEYRMDKKHGYGKYVWVDGREYEGQWMNGKMHGEGKYTLPNGESRIGVWADGKRIRWNDEEGGDSMLGAPGRRYTDEEEKRMQ